jgi:hypothetical protein
MPTKSTSDSSPATLFCLIGGVFSLLAGVLEAYFLWQSFALILEFGAYEFLLSNLVVMGPQIMAMLLALGGGVALLARLSWGWPIALGAAGFKLAMFAQLAVMFGMRAMLAIIDSTAYAQMAALSFSTGLVILLVLRPTTRLLGIRPPHVFWALGIAASLLLVWNLMLQ